MNPILDRCIFTAAFSLILCLAQSKLQMKQPTQLSKSLGYILNDNEAFWEIALEQVDGPKYFNLIKVTFFPDAFQENPNLWLIWMLKELNYLATLHLNVSLE